MFGPADHLHVMTFNIRLAHGHTRSGEPDHWPDRAPLVATLLRAEQPTLLGIQEGTFPQLPVIASALPGHGMVGYGRDGGSAGEYAAIFFDAARLRLPPHAATCPRIRPCDPLHRLPLYAAGRPMVA